MEVQITDREIAEQLIVMTLDMDYMDDSNGIQKGIDNITTDISKLKGTELYEVLKLITQQNYTDTDLLSQMQLNDEVR